LRQVAGSYVAAAGSCELRDRAAPLLTNQAPESLASEKQHALVHPPPGPVETCVGTSRG